MKKIYIQPLATIHHVNIESINMNKTFSFTC